MRDGVVTGFVAAPEECMARQTGHKQGKKRAQVAARKKAAQRKRQLRTGAFVGLGLLVISLIAVATWPEDQFGSADAEAWDLPALVGDERYALADFTGKPTVAVFFASWCTVCEVEIPEFLTVSQQIGDRVNFVGINSQDRGQGGGDADKWGITGEWPIAKDIGARIQADLSVGTFNARGMPLTVIYTSDGKVAHIQRGGISGERLVEILTELGLLT